MTWIKGIHNKVVPRRQQQRRGPQISYVVVDDQQPGPPRQLHFTISMSKHYNPLPETSVTGKESAHNLSGLLHFWEYTVSHEQPADGYTTTVNTE